MELSARHKLHYSSNMGTQKQRKMRNIILLADMEGCCGITELTDTGFCREQMAEEVDFIIQSLKDLGDYTVTVLDCHNDGLNLKEYCAEKDIPFIKHVWSLPSDAQFDAALLVGFHGKEGSDGYLSHTARADICDLRLGQTSIGEVSLLQNWLAFFNIPVIYISGDQSIENELLHYNGEFLPVKGVKIGAPPLSAQRQRIAVALRSAITKRSPVPEYCSDPVFVQIINENWLKLMPPECFTTQANGVVFHNTVEFIEKLPLLCSFLNIFEQYQYTRFRALKKLLVAAGKDFVHQHEQAKSILDQKTWRTLSDVDFQLFYSLF